VPSDGIHDDRSEDYTSDTEEKQNQRVFGHFINGTEMTFNLFKLTPRDSSQDQEVSPSDDQTFFRELSMLREMKTKQMNLSDQVQNIAIDAHRSEPSIPSSQQQTFMIPTEYSGASFVEGQFIPS
jgi:regulator of sigma D